jgi:hypothetical protein
MLRQLVLTAERTVTRASDVKEVLTAELRLENGPRLARSFAAERGLVDCGHVSGLCVRSERPLAQMGCADRVPNIVAMSEHHWVPRGVPILGSTDRHLAAFLASARWVGR